MLAVLTQGEVEVQRPRPQRRRDILIETPQIATISVNYRAENKPRSASCFGVGGSGFVLGRWRRGSGIGCLSPIFSLSLSLSLELLSMSPRLRCPHASHHLNLYHRHPPACLQNPNSPGQNSLP